MSNLKNSIGGNTRFGSSGFEITQDGTLGQQQWETAGPAPPRDFVKMIVGYALTCKMRLPAVSDTIQEARYQARKNGRSQIVATDIRTALLDYRIPSDEALQEVFQFVDKRRVVAAGTLPGSSFAPAMQRQRIRVA